MDTDAPRMFIPLCLTLQQDQQNPIVTTLKELCYVRRVLGIPADAKHLYTAHSNLWPVVAIAFSAWPGRGQETNGASSPAMALGSLTMLRCIRYFRLLALMPTVS